MLGAIKRRHRGSPFEFDRGTTDVKLLSEKSSYTDDAVMTFAVGSRDLLAAGE